MIRLLLGRVLAGVLLVLLLTLVTYVIFFRVPVDPVTYVAPEGASPEQEAAIRRELGLDDTLLEQWGTLVWRLGTEADLGNSLFGRQPVNSILKEALPPTISLVVGGFVLMLLLALPLGLLSAVKARTLVDRGILAFTVLGIVLHPFVVGILLRSVFSDQLGVAPRGGYCPLSGEGQQFGPGGFVVGTCGGAVEWLHHMWLPWVTFALFFLPLYTRMVRARVLDNLNQLYVLAARAKGASERRIVTRHVAPNALGPIVAMLAVDVAVIVTAVIYVETVFGLPGIGGLVARNLTGAVGYDLHVLVGVVVLVAIAITVVNVFADLTVRALDPRVRLEGSRVR